MSQASGGKDSARDLAQAMGGLVKSMGRFSLAMGLFAARQAARLVSEPSAETVAALDELSDAASRQLTGVVRTALAVGNNLQSGFVDAAINLMGMGARGQAPTGPTTGLSLSLTTAASRRLTGMRTVAEGGSDRSVRQVELLRRLSDYHRDAKAGDGDAERGAAGLWRSEGLAGSVARHLMPENSLADPALPRWALHIVHVGFGSGTAEVLRFDAPKIDALFTARCAREYVEFSYEGVGAALRFYERGFFKLMSGALDFIDLDAPDGPDATGFFADFLRQFPPHAQRLITHGYGRIIAFSNLDIYHAIEEATALPSKRIEPAVHGVAFAVAMMNSMDLPRILRQSAIPYEPAVRAAFQNGLIYALVFLEWFMPGMLARWTPQPGLEAELIAHARRESALSLERGFPLAARLADPRL